MESAEARKKFLDFFKKRGHKIMPSSSLLPDDATVLFTSAGMQQFSLYLEGKKDPMRDFGSRHLASCQKCFRSDDINEVGDDIHHTFFEMLGNWSIGQGERGEYFKKGAIKYALEFLVDEIGLDKDKFYITIFQGNKDIPKDEESKRIWQENGIYEKRIKEFGERDNFWGPVGNSGPCGPCSEIFYDKGEKFGCGRPDCGPNCSYCGRYVEIWNLVFMEYHKSKNGNYKKLPQKNVDTGIGFERLVAVLQKKPSSYETDLFLPIIEKLEELSNKKYDDRKHKDNKTKFRIIADHIRGACFLISEGILPSNLAQGYVLRRILRRSIRYAKVLSLPKNWYVLLIKKISEIYGEVYPEVRIKETDIITVIQNEEEKFEKSSKQGIKETLKIGKKGYITGLEMFNLYGTFSIRPEIIKELAQEHGIEIRDKKDFEIAFTKHQEISRSGKEKKFGGHDIKKLKVKSEKLKVVKLHTATHLLHAALREILGKHIKQMGSDINEERLRFDFSHPQKMTDEELKKVEDLVNQKIKENLPVKTEEMNYYEAIGSGALAFFKEKYPERVKVYSIGDPSAGSGQVFSKEICAGPHIDSTGKLGVFLIKKEQSSSAGVRRIKAVLE